MFTLSIDLESKFKKSALSKPILNSNQEEVKQPKKKTNNKQKNKKISKNGSPKQNIEEKRENFDKDSKIKEEQKQISKTKEKSSKNEKRNRISYYAFEEYKLKLIHQKLKNKYQSIPKYYNLKKINELIYNIHSKFTMTFKEYLLKDENSEFLKRVYKKNEVKIKLKKIFYFYAKYSKTYPNYIIIPEGQFMYKNILKKQKMIDKLQKIKDEELENKNNLLETSNNTIFSSNAIDSIYNLKESVNLNNLEEIMDLGLFLDEPSQMKKLNDIIQSIKDSESIKPKVRVFTKKKQTIYKKELPKKIHELSKSYYKITNVDNLGESKKLNIEDTLKLASTINENEIYKTHKILTQKFGDPIITLGDDFEKDQSTTKISPLTKYKKFANSNKNKKNHTTSKFSFTYVKGKTKFSHIGKISSQNSIINQTNNNTYDNQTYDSNEKVLLTESINDCENNKPIYKKLKFKMHFPIIKTLTSTSFTPSNNSNILKPKQYLYVKKSCNDSHGKTIGDFYKNKIIINTIDYNKTLSSSLSKNLRRSYNTKLEKRIYSHIKRKYFQNYLKNGSESKKINHEKNNVSFKNNSMFSNKIIGRNSIKKFITRHNTNLTSSNYEEFIDKENNTFNSGKIKKLTKKKNTAKIINIDSPIYEKTHKISKIKSLGLNPKNFEEVKNEKKNEDENCGKATQKTYKKTKIKNKK